MGTLETTDAYRRIPWAKRRDQYGCMVSERKRNKFKKKILKIIFARKELGVEAHPFCRQEARVYTALLSFGFFHKIVGLEDIFSNRIFSPHLHSIRKTVLKLQGQAHES